MSNITKFLTKYKSRIIATACVVLILTVAFFYGDSDSKTDKKTTAKTFVSQTVNTTKPSVSNNTVLKSKTQTTVKSTQNKTVKTTVKTTLKKNTSTLKSTKITQKTKTTNKQIYSCTLSISCDTILDNLSLLKEEKKGLIPKDGWILKPTKINFEKGQSVFDIFLAFCKNKKIHMEYSGSTAYNSAYVSGINNIYEFDCGALSGWRYNVNGTYPNYGCSKYEVENGDKINWVFTCDGGNDIGS